jgi:hypothetical protein
MRASLWFLGLLAGCDAVITTPAGSIALPAGGGPGASPEPTFAGPQSVPELPPAAVCQNAPSGRGYLGLAGERLEAGRTDTAGGVEGHRPFRNFMENNTWTLVREVRGALGAGGAQDPEAVSPGVGACFGAPPRGWYEPSTVGPFAVFTTFSYAFKVCERTIAAPPAALKAGWYEHTAFEPTAERADTFCRRAQKSAWLREPSADEVRTCVELALDLGTEPDFKKRWAYVCASVLASVNFLAN